MIRSRDRAGTIAHHCYQAAQRHGQTTGDFRGGMAELRFRRSSSRDKGRHRNCVPALSGVTRLLFVPRRQGRELETAKEIAPRTISFPNWPDIAPPSRAQELRFHRHLAGLHPRHQQWRRFTRRWCRKRLRTFAGARLRRRGRGWVKTWFGTHARDRAATVRVDGQTARRGESADERRGGVISRLADRTPES